MSDPSTPSAHPLGPAVSETQDALVERVAEVIYEAERWDFERYKWSELADSAREPYRATARAVIPLVVQEQRNADVEIIRPVNDVIAEALRHAPLVTDPFTETEKEQR